jgi:HEAT repeat protein
MGGPGNPLSALLSTQVFLALTLTVLTLLGMATFFAVVTFVLRLKNEKEDRRWADLLRSWEPLLLEALYEPEKLQGLWDSVDEKYHLDFLEFNLQYSQRLGGPEKQTLKLAAAPYLEAVRPLLNHRRVGVRARAVQTLGTLGMPEFMEEVKAAVDDPAPFVAALAARLVARQAGPEEAQDFCRRLSRFKTFRNWYLVDMVVDLGPQAIPAIREALADPDRPAQIRAVAAHSLSVLGDLAAAELAGELATTEEDPGLLASLMRLLARVGTGELSSAARAHLDADEFFVRAAATRALSELGGAEDLPYLVEKLNDPSAWVRLAAARGVYHIGSKRAFRALSRGDDPAAPLFRQVLAEEAGK